MNQRVCLCEFVPIPIISKCRLLQVGVNNLDEVTHSIIIISYLVSVLICYCFLPVKGIVSISDRLVIRIGYGFRKVFDIICILGDLPLFVLNSYLVIVLIISISDSTYWISYSQQIIVVIISVSGSSQKGICDGNPPPDTVISIFRLLHQGIRNFGEIPCRIVGIGRGISLRVSDRQWESMGVVGNSCEFSQRVGGLAKVPVGIILKGGVPLKRCPHGLCPGQWIIVGVISDGRYNIQCISL